MRRDVEFCGRSPQHAGGSRSSALQYVQVNHEHDHVLSSDPRRDYPDVQVNELMNGVTT